LRERGRREKKNNKEERNDGQMRVMVQRVKGDILWL